MGASSAANASDAGGAAVSCAGGLLHDTKAGAAALPQLRAGGAEPLLLAAGCRLTPSHRRVANPTA